MIRALVLYMILVGAAAARATPDPVAAQAVAHFQTGLKHYNLSEWEAALESFREAYLIKPDANFLFNIAQCQRQLGQFDNAEKSYRAFLRESPDAAPDQVDQVKRLIAQMEAAARESRQPPTGVAAPGAPVEAVTQKPPKPAPVATPIYKRWWLWTVVGVVGIGAAVGLGLGLAPHATRYPNPGGTPNATFSF